MLIRRGVVAAFTLSALLVVAALPTAGYESTAEFPSGFEAYHTYTEMVAVLDATVAAHPAIARKFAIGTSYEGRPIWALKISDNVHVDEDEPEVLSVSLMHAREHITTEMNIYLINLLTDSYGSSQRITDIVNTREIFVVPIANPDGGEWDIASGKFRKWRKNRQPNAGVSAVGTDLNRNFGYKWRCCNGSSGDPASATYRGKAAWSSPENRVLRNFIDSRVVGGRQQIKAIFSWHSYGEQVMWPYGYTRKDVPRTMSADDHAAMVALGTGMAQLNGYRPMQASELYLHDGDFMAWAYGAHRIVGFTIEMYPQDGLKVGGFYPQQSVIERETSRNRRAVLYLLEQANCPHRAAGFGATHCGPLNDDLETGRGWSVNAAGSDTATKGAWQRAIPQITRTGAGVKQQSATPSGQHSLVTGAKAGAKAGAKDLDGGLTSVLSPELELSSDAGWRVAFHFYFSHGSTASSADFLRLRVVAAGTTTTVFEQRGASSERKAKWAAQTVNLDSFAGQSVRLLFEAADMGADSLIEAALDDIRVFRNAGGTSAAGLGDLPLAASFLH